MSDRTIRRTPEYGTSLRRQLDAVGWTQAQLASESRVSRQTISRAINQDEVSDRTRARIDAALARAPARARSPRRHGTGSRPLPTGTALCDATDLEAWADRREAQSVLPRLVRRLMRATGVRLTKLHVRTDEGIQLSGWDGILHAGEGSPYAPAGPSGWEMSVAMRPKKEADDNWTKRTQYPAPLTPEDSTFVFVTPRRWRDKEKWAHEKTDQGPWRDVRVYDADDLAAWLEEAPAVHTWLSIKIGKIPSGTNDLEAYWNEWSGASRPALTPAIVLSGRDEAVADMRRRLSEVSGQALAVQAESREEAIAWTYCVIRDLPSETADSILARCLVVHSPEAFRQLTGARAPLVLVPSFDSEELAAAAARAGHAVVVPLDRGCPTRGDDVIRIPPVSRQSVADALRESRYENDRAYRMAGLAVRSLTAFRRSIARVPVSREPGWSKPGAARGLVPALLAGSWNDANPEDRKILARLGRRPYEEVVEVLIEWSFGSDPVVRRKEDAWYLVSFEDTWRLLGGYVLRHDLERFEDIALSVLGGVDPVFDLSPDERWMADALGHTPKHSGLLRSGLTKTLAVMGAHGAEIPSPAFLARDTSERIVRKLLESANTDWRLWASLVDHLSAFAEAAPAHFLEAVEEGLGEPDPALSGLFETDGDPPSGSHLHTGLVSALEVLAWSPDHLGRVVPLLARLDLLDPESELRPSEGGRSRVFPRPLSVLKAIFRSWLPETSATLDERLTVLDGLRASHGPAAWNVMISMLPEITSVGIPTARPSVRDWAVNAGQAVAHNERARTIAEVVVRLLEDAGSRGRKWVEILGRLHMLPVREHSLVVGALEALDPAELAAETQAAIWEALRGICARHRAHSTARWAMPEEYMARLDEILERFSPDDPVALYGWLFTQRPPSVDTGQRGRVPWEVRRQRISDERAKAVVAILERAGLTGLTEFAKAVEDPSALGFATASAQAALLQPDDLLLRHLADPHHALRQLAFGYAQGRVHGDGEDWLVQQLERADLQLTARQRVELLLALPPATNTWRVATACGEDIARGYWHRVAPNYVEDDDLAEAVSCLVAAERPFVAADLIAFTDRVNKDVVPPGTCGRASFSGDIGDR